MGLVRQAFFNELIHFRKLNKQGQKLLLSIFLYNLTHPIFAIFINAFIWRQSQDMAIVAIYNIAHYAALPLGFYINGYLMKRISTKRLYFAGALFRALALLLLIFVPNLTPFYIISFGLCFGLLSGIFWSNRNLLTVKLTDTTNRIYFSTLDFMSLTLSNILVPLFIGAFIVYGSTNHMYTPIQGYYAVMIATILITILLSSIIKKIQVQTPQVPHVIHRHATKQWNCARGVTGLFGLMNGIFSFFPVILVLHYLGKEDTLGIVQSIAAVLTGIVLYAVARSINTKYRVGMIGVSLAVLFVGALSMAISFTPISIFVFIAIFTFSMQLLYTEAYSIVMDLVDRENTGKDNRYGYVFDMELFLNIGRVTGIFLFLYYIEIFSTDFAMRYTPLMFVILQFALLFLAKAIEDRKVVVPVTQRSELMNNKVME